jgi:microcystin-dependent protein
MTECYVGEVRPFGGNFAPVGWHLCDGSLLAISSYPVLYNLIGTTYGGNGTSTFGLPDLRGRAMIHQGQGPGLSTYIMGQQIGVENATVAVAQMAGHPHSFNATSQPGSTGTPGSTVLLAGSPAGHLFYSATGPTTPLSPHAVSNAGGSQPHANRQPYLAITYIIALEGIYPPQN